MSVIGIPALAAVVVLAYLAAGRDDDDRVEPVRSTISTVFWAVVLVEVGIVGGIVDAVGGSVAYIVGVVV